MRTKAEAGNALKMFTDDVGAVAKIVVDQSKEQTMPGSTFMKIANWIRAIVHRIEKYSPWQNRAEAAIGLLKKRWRQRCAAEKVPSRLWEYGLVYDAEVLSRTVTISGKRTGWEKVTGDTPDISEWLDFPFYGWV
mmetsp:Transcript_5560/g.8528  ORF Transcript_5560/g.8528 Transcript_5560/m.8528 type:complete len:135 (-) Transcript_5560:93-497(-)